MWIFWLPPWSEPTLFCDWGQCGQWTVDVISLVLPVNIKFEVPGHVPAEARGERRGRGLVCSRWQIADTSVRRRVAVGARVAWSGTSVRHGCDFSTEQFFVGTVERYTYISIAKAADVSNSLEQFFNVHPFISDCAMRKIKISSVKSFPIFMSPWKIRQCNLLCLSWWQLVTCGDLRPLRPLLWSK